MAETTAKMAEDELLRIAHRQIAEQHSFDHGEDRRVGADAESQRQHRDGGKAAVLGEHSGVHHFTVGQLRGLRIPTA